MGRQNSRSRMAVRTRHVAIYTFVLILGLFYTSAHMTLEKERGKEEAGLETGRTDAAGADASMPEEAGADAGMQDAAETEMGRLEAEEIEASLSEEPEAGLSEFSQDELWCLILTNAEYPVPEDYQTDLKVRDVPGTRQAVDERICDDLAGMLKAMEAEKLSPKVCSGYRTLDKQEKLFNRKVRSFVKKGHSKEESYTLARQVISIPGSGEHCLGLAVDFYGKDYHSLERGFENTPEGRWLVEHAQDYGFILRYPEDKEDITGIQYEPWHYRYVGVKAARYMKKEGLCLEEFYIEQSLYG